MEKDFELMRHLLVDFFGVGQEGGGVDIFAVQGIHPFAVLLPIILDIGKVTGMIDILDAEYMGAIRNGDGLYLAFNRSRQHGKTLGKGFEH